MINLYAPWRAAGAAATLVCLGLGAGAAQAEDRALLIGVANYPEPQNDLRGPRADVAAVSEALVERFGYEQNQILKLLDGAATREGVIAAIETHLIFETFPDDRVFLYYSGHGVRIPDANSTRRDEADGFDEALAPYDHATAGVLIDDDLGDLLDRLQGRRTTVVFDSCHSGEATRSIAPRGEPWRRERRLYDRGSSDNLGSPTFSSGAMGGLSATASGSNGAGLRSDSSNFAGAATDREVWSAAQPHQRAYESDVNGEVRGLFTLALLEAAQPGVSRADVLAHVNAAVQGEITRQFARVCRPGDQDCPQQTPHVEAPRPLMNVAFGMWPNSDYDPRAVEVITVPSDATEAQSAPTAPTDATAATATAQPANPGGVVSIWTPLRVPLQPSGADTPVSPQPPAPAQISPEMTSHNPQPPILSAQPPTIPTPINTNSPERPTAMTLLAINIPRGLAGTQFAVQHEDGPDIFPLRSDDPIAFNLTAPLTGDLTLIFVSEDGREVEQLSPDPWADGQTLQFTRGRPAIIPDAFNRSAYDLRTDGTYVAVFAPEGDLESVTDPQTRTTNRAVRDPQAYLRALIDAMGRTNGASERWRFRP